MTTPRRTFLFTMWEGGGTLPPELGVARRLLERGHRVHVLADPTVADRAEALGCGFTPWRRAPHRTSLDPAEDLFRDWEVRNPLRMLGNARDRFVAGPADEFAADTVEAIEAVGPDAVVADAMMLGTIVGAEATRTPVAALVPNIWFFPTPGAPAAGPGFAPARTALGRARDTVLRNMANRVFDRGLPALNGARAAHGLPPLRSLWDQLLGVDRILVLSSAAFDIASAAVPDNVAYVGPVLDDPDWVEPWESPWPGGDDRPLVLVGFSSTFQDQVPLLQRLVDALAALPVRAVVTLGQMLDPAEVPGRGDVVVVPSAPHGELLRHADVVVSHCGHGTTLKALAVGVPLVCIPMGRDQPDTAARVIYHGAGRRVPASASTRRIRRAVEAVLADPQHRTAARRLAAAIADELQAGDVVGELEATATRRETRADQTQPTNTPGETR